MLANYLKNMRASRVVTQAHALQTLGNGWAQGADGAIERQFTFGNWSEAAHFLQRYTDISQKLNHAPEWSNVYNRVNVRLANQEFNGITTKELEIGQYLNRVSGATLSVDVDDITE